MSKGKGTSKSDGMTGSDSAASVAPLRIESPLGASGMFSMSRSYGEAVGMASGLFSAPGIGAMEDKSLGMGMDEGWASGRSGASPQSAATSVAVGSQRGPVAWALSLMGTGTADSDEPRADGTATSVRRGTRGLFVLSGSADLQAECSDDAVPLVAVAQALALAGTSAQSAIRAVHGIAVREGILPTPPVSRALVRALAASGRGSEAPRVLRDCVSIAAELGATPTQRTALEHAPSVAAACIRALGAEGDGHGLIAFWRRHCKHQAEAAEAAARAAGGRTDDHLPGSVHHLLDAGTFAALPDGSAPP